MIWGLLMIASVQIYAALVLYFSIMNGMNSRTTWGDPLVKKSLLWPWYHVLRPMIRKSDDPVS